MPLTPFDHLLALVLAVVFPLRSRIGGFQDLTRAAPEDQPSVRGRLYRNAMAIQWTLAAAAGALWIATGRRADALGLSARPTLAVLSLLGGVAAVLAALTVQAWRVRRSERALERLLPRLVRVHLMLPHSPEELRRFVLLSLTAGICEELLYRGFLLFYFGHWLGPWTSLAAASLIFGLGHAYQGPRGVLQTGLIGAFLGFVYMIGRSLLPPMLLHAAGDVYSGSIAQAALCRAAAPPGEPSIVSDPAGGPPPAP